MNKRTLLASLAVTVFAAACSTTTPQVGADPVAKRAEIDAKVDGALTKLYTQAAGSPAMVNQAKGVLVFPSVISAGLVVGGSHGDGALRVNGVTEGYYSTTAASVGLIAGADSKAVYVLFLTDEALTKFRASKGWTAGADASVSVLNSGADLGVDTQTGKRAVVGYVLTNGGLMANVAIDGTKVSKINL